MASEEVGFELNLEEWADSGQAEREEDALKVGSVTQHTAQCTKHVGGWREGPPPWRLP